MGRTKVIGRSGRLGSVVADVLAARGDELVTSGPLNYLVFAHRYRGPADFREEMSANVLMVAEMIDSSVWSEGDCAVVVVSSIASFEPAPDQGFAYSASKAALNNLVKFYDAYMPECPRINAVCPAGFTAAESLITAGQVADVIAFLCSPQGSGISGQSIRVG